MDDFYHAPVLLAECLEGLNIKPNGIYVDGTLGGAGHAAPIAARLSEGRLIGIDQDGDAIDFAKKKLKPFGEKAVVIKGNFKESKSLLASLGIYSADGFLLDLGVSSHQLDEGSRGFSYMHDARLDMRMDANASLDAFEIVNSYPEEKLMKIFFEYGEERHSKRIAARIASCRKDKPIETTFELVDAVKSAVPKKAQIQFGHPAKRIFQAIRIEANKELPALEQALDDMVDMLNPGGRLLVISYHSLEDRIAKTKFKSWENPCTCPPDFPVCVCGLKPKATIITRKPISPSPEEQAVNRRSRSAKLRVCQKLGA
ncbi:MAG: 16S rRNA (cytosine(1402)-N(4))-methyltransferase RsmH [Clostridiales bacterium]|jgi:16S rRNA (cytosine1402-N4)-methyltransferase|nr:16S rRNA (cytosine(1402)-N(4))-methyltransferase RsmH [Clostridiales bacterium]